jgi:hypothetical protein
MLAWNPRFGAAFHAQKRGRVAYYSHPREQGDP